MNFEPKINGTATFEMVDIEWHDQQNEFRVLGYYNGEPSTEYSVPEGALSISGMEVRAGAKTRLTLDPGDGEWIYATATDDKLNLAIEK